MKIQFFLAIIAVCMQKAVFAAMPVWQYKSPLNSKDWKDMSMVLHAQTGSYSVIYPNNAKGKKLISWLDFSKTASTFCADRRFFSKQNFVDGIYIYVSSDNKIKILNKDLKIIYDNDLVYNPHGTSFVLGKNSQWTFGFDPKTTVSAQGWAVFVQSSDSKIKPQGFLERKGPVEVYRQKFHTGKNQSEIWVGLAVGNNIYILAQGSKANPPKGVMILDEKKLPVLNSISKKSWKQGVYFSLIPNVSNKKVYLHIQTKNRLVDKKIEIPYLSLSKYENALKGNSIKWSGSYIGQAINEKKGFWKGAWDGFKIGNSISNDNNTDSPGLELLGTVAGAAGGSMDNYSYQTKWIATRFVFGLTTGDPTKLMETITVSSNSSKSK